MGKKKHCVQPQCTKNVRNSVSEGDTPEAMLVTACVWYSTKHLPHHLVRSVYIFFFLDW